MLFWNELRWLHENLPYSFLRLWGSSKKAIFLSKYLGFGGKKYFQYCKLLDDMQGWSLDKIYEFQFEKLKKLLEHAYNNVPYYKNVFSKESLKPSNIKCLEDLQKLPTITKEGILANYKKFFARNLWYKRKVYRYTSGTSGRPLKVCMDDGAIAVACATANSFQKRFLGYSHAREVVFHAPLCNAYPYFLLNGNRYNGFYTPVTKQVIFSWYLVGAETFSNYIALIKKFKIRRVEGLPSIFFAFAKYLADRGEYLNVETALLVGEVLYGFQRRLIEKQLGCEVFNRYGQIEVTTLAYECSRHNGMHISPLVGITEIDGRGLKGKGGVVTTGLCNYAFPLIRYSIGDIVTMSQKECSCGCAFPRLMSIEGRENDFIVLPEGGYLHPMPFAWLIVTISGIKDIFFLQNEDYSLDIFVVKEDKVDADEIKCIIKKKVEGLLKNKLKIDIIVTDSITRRSSKYKVVETKIPLFKE